MKNTIKRNEFLLVKQGTKPSRFNVENHNKTFPSFLTFQDSLTKMASNVDSKRL